MREEPQIITGTKSGTHFQSPVPSDQHFRDWAAAGMSAIFSFPLLLEFGSIPSLEGKLKADKSQTSIVRILLVV